MAIRYSKILIKRGTKEALERNIETLLDNETVFAYDIPAMGVKRGNRITWIGTSSGTGGTGVEYKYSVLDVSELPQADKDLAGIAAAVGETGKKNIYIVLEDLSGYYDWINMGPIHSEFVHSVDGSSYRYSVENLTDLPVAAPNLLGVAAAVGPEGAKIFYIVLEDENGTLSWVNIGPIQVGPKGDKGADGNSLISDTYANIKALRDNGDLVSGAFYRITDYETTCNYDDVEVANHYFDIIVQALDNKTLSQNTSAIERTGQTYYKNNNVNLGAWELKYDIDNDNTKYDWAVSNGKGVIFGMKDDKGNEVGYDFKNIKFKRMFIASGNEFINRFSILNRTGVPMYFYLFSVIDENGLVNDNSVKPFENKQEIPSFARLNHISPYIEGFYDVDDNIVYKIGNNTMIYDLSYYGDYQFNGFNNNTIGNGFNNNTIGHSFRSNTIGNDFNNNTIGDNFYNNTIGNSFYSNTIGNDFYNNTIGNSFYSNTIGNSFYSNTIGNGFKNNNTIGNSFYSNTIGNDFYYNTIGNFFYYNTIGNSFYSNTIGNDFYYNTIDNFFRSNTIGDSFYYNTIGNDFRSNTIGDNFYNNTIGSDFVYNTIGNSFNNNTIGNDFNNNTIGNSFRSNTIGNSIGYLKTVDKTNSQRIQYIHIENGISGNSSSNLLDLTNTGTILTGFSQTTPTIISRDSSGWLMLKRSGLTSTGKRKTTISGNWGDL